MPTDYQPIPTPLRQRWKVFRTEFLPLGMLLLSAVAVYMLWDLEVTPVGLPGEVYGQHSEVPAPATGWIRGLALEPFSEVRAGDILAQIEVMPAPRMEAALAVLQAELALMERGGLDPILDQQRNLLNEESLKRDWLQARADLASLRVRARQAELDFRRISQLFEREQVSASDFDQARATFEALSAEETERAHLVESLERAVQRVRGPENGNDGLASLMQGTLALQETRLRALEAELLPIPLIAPISGIVTELFRTEGEFAQAGTPLMTLRATEPEFIVGYLKMPTRWEPTVGTSVWIDLPDGRRRDAQPAQVLRVGAHFEPMGPAFQHPVALREERALPIKISLPPDLPLRPGQIVQIRPE